LKAKFINYFFDKEVIKKNKLYVNVFYYSIIGIFMMTLILGVL